MIGDTHKKELGQSAEAFVAQQLVYDGYTVVARNYRARYGEIDIVACKDSQYHFVEVKCRRRMSFDLGLLVNYTKQQKIIKTARGYLAHETDGSCGGQFDVALVHATQSGYQLDYISNAFWAQ